MRIIHSPMIGKILLVKDWLLAFFFPVYCLDCKVEGHFLCPACRQKLPPPGGDELPNWIMAGFDYGDERVRELIWRLKYQKQTAVAKEMAEMLWPMISGELLETSGPIWLVPVPLFWWRRWQRGYNQAEILAKQLAKIRPDKFVVKNNLIKKIKNTSAQAKIKKRNERLANLAGAFVINQKAGQINPRQIIILIDDVTTTGATLSELRRLLIRAGLPAVPAHAGQAGVHPRHLRALVFAHG